MKYNETEERINIGTREIWICAKLKNVLLSGHLLPSECWQRPSAVSSAGGSDLRSGLVKIVLDHLRAAGPSVWLDHPHGRVVRQVEGNLATNNNLCIIKRINFVRIPTTLGFKKWANHQPLLRLFLVFSNKQYTFYSESLWKNVIYIQYTVLGFEPMTSRTWVISHNH